MKLRSAVEIYIGKKQASGLSYAAIGKILRRFARFTGNVQLTAISSETVNAFFEHYSLSNNAWSAYSSYLHSFFIYWRARRQIKRVPVPRQKPRQASTFFSYIYKREEIRLFLKSTSTTQADRKCIVDSETLRFLILFLYATGINVEDSLRLGVNEVDLKRRRIEVEKYSRSRRREIPIGADLATRIGRYLRTKSRAPASKYLFATIYGKQIPYAVIQTAFVRLRRFSGINRADSRFQPRILDLRHSFIVHSLTRLLEREYEMAKALPMVAAYVGSTDLKNFSRYADLVPHTFSGQLRSLCHANTAKL